MKSKMEKKQELLCVSWHSTMPQDTGANVRIRNILANYDTLSPVLLSPPPNDAAFDHYMFQMPGWIAPLNKFTPFNAEILCCLGRSVFKSTLKNLSGRSFVAVQCEHLWTYPLAKKLADYFDVPLILVEHNIEATYVARAYKNARLGRFIYSLEAKALKGSDRVAVCSHIDADILQREFSVPHEKIWVVPNGVTMPENEAAYPREKLPAELRARKFMVFLGKTSYQPNREAIEIIKHELAPRLKRSESELVIAIVGGPAKADFSTIDDGYVFTGFVPEKEPFLYHAAACIAPLVSGSGTRLKILEYAAFGCAILATEIAAEGIELESSTEMLVANDWDTFVEKMGWLVENEATTKTLGDRARLKIQEKYQWKSIALKLEQQILHLK